MVLLVFCSQGPVSGHLTALTNLVVSCRSLLKEGTDMYEKKMAKPEVDN